MEDARKITKAADAYKVLRTYAARKQEHFLVITLDGGHHVIKKHVAIIGLANRTLIHPMEVFFHAINNYSVAIIIAHNHPSGNLDPSFEDHEVTKQMKRDGVSYLGFRFLIT